MSAGSEEKIADLEEQLRAVTQMLAAVVQSVGGEIRVSRQRLESVEAYPLLHSWLDPQTGSWVLRA